MPNSYFSRHFMAAFEGRELRIVAVPEECLRLFEQSRIYFSLHQLFVSLISVLFIHCPLYLQWRESRFWFFIDCYTKRGPALLFEEGNTFTFILFAPSIGLKRGERFVGGTWRRRHQNWDWPDRRNSNAGRRVVPFEQLINWRERDQ